MSKRTILVVEDDPNIRFGLQEVLEGEGFAVACCERGDDAEARLRETQPALVILDVMLPGRSGYDICKDLRRNGAAVPILMLTAKSQELDKVVGLDAGADDYVTKPFGVRELVARVHALLRRAGGDGAERGGGKESGPFQVGEAQIDPKTYEVHRGDRSERLTPKEMDLLIYLDAHRGEVLRRDDILDAVWGIKYFGTTRTLDQCVAQLRKKTGDNGPSPKHLQTVHGVGYRLVD